MITLRDKQEIFWNVEQKINDTQFMWKIPNQGKTHKCSPITKFHYEPRVYINDCKSLYLATGIHNTRNTTKRMKAHTTTIWNDKTCFGIWCTPSRCLKPWLRFQPCPPQNLFTSCLYCFLLSLSLPLFFLASLSLSATQMRNSLIVLLSRFSHTHNCVLSLCIVFSLVLR